GEASRVLAEIGRKIRLKGRSGEKSNGLTNSSGCSISRSVKSFTAAPLAPDGLFLSFLSEDSSRCICLRTRRARISHSGGLFPSLSSAFFPFSSVIEATTRGASQTPDANRLAARAINKDRRVFFFKQLIVFFIRFLLYS